jgi:DNA-binding beta-propeller fold protein YncE
VVNSSGDSVSVIDIDPTSPTYNQVIDTNPSTPPLDNVGVGNPLGIGITPDGTRAYVTNTSNDTITVIYLSAESDSGAPGSV